MFSLLSLTGYRYSSIRFHITEDDKIYIQEKRMIVTLTLKLFVNFMKCLSVIV